MRSRTKSKASLALALLIGFAQACSPSGSGDETGRANKLVAEANTAIDAANKATDEASRKNERIFDEIKSDSFAADKQRLSAAAREAVTGYKQSAEKFREAAGKFEEAARLKLNDKFKEYLVLKSQEFNKHAERVEAAGMIPQAVLESDAAETLSQKYRENKTRYERLEREARELADRAEKVRAENKNIFQAENSNK